MNEIVFVPQYSSQVYWGFVILPLVEIFALWELLVNKTYTPPVISLACVIGLVLLLPFITPFGFTRRIRFRMEGIVVERYLRPPKVIAYYEVLDIGTNSIKTQQGLLNFRQLTNAEALRNILKELSDRGVINKYQIEGKLDSLEKAGWKAWFLAVLIALPLSIAIQLVWPLPEFYGRMSFPIFALLIYLIIDWFFKSREI